MSDLLACLLARRPYLLADGAMGTSLFERGLESGDAPELWNVEQRDRVADVHRGMIAAGADIVLTNSFGGTRYRLKLHGLQDRAEELNGAAAEIAREAAEASGREVVVAGSIGPTGELFVPVGTLGHEDGLAAFAEQARGLKAGGADVLWIETMSSREEVAAAHAGAAGAGLPIVTTLTFDTAGRTMMGVSPQDALDFCRELRPAPLAIGSNCGAGPAEVIASIVGMREAAVGEDVVIVAKGNCGIPEFVDGAVRFSGTPELMADYARMARDAGARIIGACCGSTDEIIRTVAQALDGYAPNPAPDIAAIEDRLGELGAGTKAAQALAEGAPAEGPESRRRGRRRRRG